MTAPDKIWATVGYIGKHDTRVRGEFDTEPSEKAIPYVPLALAQAAVAAAYEAAAQVCDSGNAGAFWGKAIRALATPDQIAALAAERGAAVTVNPLVWECVSWASGDGVKGENDDTWEAETPFNDTPFVIEWHGSDKFVLTMPNGETHYSGSLEAAKATFQTIHEAAIRSAVTITSGASTDTITLPRAEVEALMEVARAFQLIRAVWTDPHNDDLMRKASMTLDALRERMK